MAEAQLVWDAVVGRGTTINGLTILNKYLTLKYYFLPWIIARTGAFVKISSDYQAYSGTFLQKLIKEVTNIGISVLPYPGDPLRLAV